jgi:hypothetical protein
LQHHDGTTTAPRRHHDGTTTAAQRQQSGGTAAAQRRWQRTFSKARAVVILYRLCVSKGLQYGIAFQQNVFDALYVL